MFLVPEGPPPRNTPPSAPGPHRSRGAGTPWVPGWPSVSCLYCIQVPAYLAGIGRNAVDVAPGCSYAMPVMARLQEPGQDAERDAGDDHAGRHGERRAPREPAFHDPRSLCGLAE